MDNKITQEIQNQLKDMEREQNIEVLFAVENGSRAWGFKSKDSDFDIRFVYVSTLKNYIEIGSKKRDTIDKMIDYEETVLDFSGWDLRKFLFLLSKSNPASLEWLDSPMLYYGTRERFSPIEDFVNIRSLAYHYHSIAKQNYHRFIDSKEEVKLKKYFYVLRGILNAFYVVKNKRRPPMSFSETISSLSSQFPEFIEKSLIERIEELLEVKRQGEDVETDRLDELESFIQNWFVISDSILKETETIKKEVSYDRANSILYDILNIKK